MSEDDKPRGKPAVKAKMPDAKNIKRPDFTPHGIGGGKGRAPRPSALTAAQAKKRRQIMAIVLVVAVIAVAGGTTYYLTRPGPKLEVSGAFAKEPKVKIPKSITAPKALKATTLVTGSGAKIANGDSAFVRFVFYKWPAKTASGSPAPDPSADPKKPEGLIGSTYSQPEGQRIVPMVVGKSGLKGIDKALPGKTVGSRVMLEIPPADGFGKEGNPQAGITGTDSLLFVMDVVATYPKTAAATGAEVKQTDKNLPTVVAGKPGEVPKVTIPKVAPPGKLQVKTLIQGTGPVVEKGQTLVTNYVGQIWRNSQTFDSSWQRGSPATFEIGTGKVVKGWDTGLVGQKIGSRVLLVLPPADGYKEGNPQAGIKKTDVLSFVVDILGTLPKS